MSKSRRDSVIALLLITIVMAACNHNSFVVDRDSLVLYNDWGSCPGCISRYSEITGKGDITYKYSSLASGEECENHVVLKDEEISELLRRLIDAGVMKVHVQNSQMLDAGTSVFVKYRSRELKGNTIPKMVSDIFMELLVKYECLPRTTHE